MDFLEIQEMIKPIALYGNTDIIAQLPNLAPRFPEISSQKFLRRLTYDYFHADSKDLASLYKKSIKSLLTEDNAWGVLDILSAFSGTKGFWSFPDIYEQRSESRFASLLFCLAEEFGTIKEKKIFPVKTESRIELFKRIVNLSEIGLRRDLFHENFSLRYHMVANKLQTIEFTLSEFQPKLVELWETCKSIANKTDTSKFPPERKCSTYRKLLYVGQEIYTSSCRIKQIQISKDKDEAEKHEKLRKNIFLYAKAHISFLKHHKLRNLWVPRSPERLEAGSIALKTLSVAYAFGHPTDDTAKMILANTFSKSFLDPQRNFAGKKSQMEILRIIGKRPEGEVFMSRLVELTSPHMPEIVRTTAQEVLEPTRGRAAERRLREELGLT